MWFGETPRILVATTVLGATGCYRSVDLTPAASTALSSSTHPPREPVVVGTIDGERRQLDTFDALIVEARECAEPSCPERVMKFLPPLRIDQRENAVRVIAANREQLFERGRIERMTVRELAPGRTAIVAGVAIGLGIAAGYLTYWAAGGCDESSNDDGDSGSGFGCAGFFFAVPAAGAAGSLSLLVTLPLTKPLGTPVD
jgi:hypothetical protein